MAQVQEVTRNKTTAGQAVAADGDHRKTVRPVSATAGVGEVRMLETKGARIGTFEAKPRCLIRVGVSSTRHS